MILFSIQLQRASFAEDNVNSFFKRREVQVALLLLSLSLAIIFTIVLLRKTFFKENYLEKFKSLYTVLVLSESQSGKLAAANLVFVFPDRGYVHIYRVNPEVTFTRWWGKNQALSDKSLSSLMSSLEKSLNLKIPYYILVNDKKTDRLLDDLGGAPIFNTYSEPMTKGETIIVSGNQKEYFEGINVESSFRDDAAFSLWINLLMRTLNDFERFKDPSLGAKIVWSSFKKSNFPKDTFIELFNMFSARSNSIYLSAMRMNTEIQKTDNDDKKGSGILVPLDAGNYDANKLRGVLELLEKDDKSLKVFPLTLQIKNTTEVPRLAAKTAGLLRIKRFDVKEYLNTSFHLKHSVIICRSGSAAQRDYLKKVSKVQRVYYDFDYRENFDLTLYLGEDYYAIPYLSNN